MNRPARLAAACSRAGGNGSSEASGTAADGWGLAVAAGRAVVLAGAAGPAACGSREQPPQASPAAASSPAARPARAARLVIVVLAGAGLAGCGVPGGRGGVRRVPGQAAGRAARFLAVRAAVGRAAAGRGDAGRGELGEPQARAGAAGGQPGGPGRALGAGAGGGGRDRDAGDLRGGGGVADAGRRRAGQPALQRGLAARAAQVEQDRGGDAGAGGEGGVPGELGDDPAERLGAGVVLEEEVDGGGRLAGEPARSSGRTRRGGRGRPRWRRSAARPTSIRGPAARCWRGRRRPGE